MCVCVCARRRWFPKKASYLRLMQAWRARQSHNLPHTRAAVCRQGCSVSLPMTGRCQRISIRWHICGIFECALQTMDEALRTRIHDTCKYIYVCVCVRICLQGVFKDSCGWTVAQIAHWTRVRVYLTAAQALAVHGNAVTGELAEKT